MSHQEMVLVFSVQVKGIVPLENTWCYTTLTTHEQYQTQSPNFFRVLLYLTIHIPKNTEKKIHTQYMNRTLSKEECSRSEQVQW
jgi:hypothetical protein